MAKLDNAGIGMLNSSLPFTCVECLPSPLKALLIAACIIRPIAQKSDQSKSV
jgi:hypothetical protein